MMDGLWPRLTPWGVNYGKNARVRMSTGNFKFVKKALNNVVFSIEVTVCDEK